MKVGDLVKLKQVLGSAWSGDPGYGVIVDFHGGDMGKVIWQGIACNSSWEMLHDLVDAARELTVFK